MISRALLDIFDGKRYVYSLINDIIRLSQLEERGETPMETQDLYAVALEAVEALKDTVKQNEVSIRCTGAAVSHKRRAAIYMRLSIIYVTMPFDTMSPGYVELRLTRKREQPCGSFPSVMIPDRHRAC